MQDPDRSLAAGDEDSVQGELDAGAGVCLFPPHAQQRRDDLQPLAIGRGRVFGCYLDLESCRDIIALGLFRGVYVHWCEISGAIVFGFS